MTGEFSTTYNFLRYDVCMKEKKDNEHKHFANDDPTEFDQDKSEDLAKEAIKKFKSLNG
tara:strand:- start:167 stop:343 length:177 start_codon:yes stop_codon:yes gene_type:complete